MRILIARCAWCSFSLPPQPQQHLFKPSEISGAGASPGNGLALRVLEFNNVGDALPSGTLCERRLKVLDVIRLLVPITMSMPSMIRSARQQKDVLVFADRSLLFGSVLFIELIDGSLCPGDGLLTLCFTRLVSLLDLLCLFLAPFPVPKRKIEYMAIWDSCTSLRT